MCTRRWDQQSFRVKRPQITPYIFVSTAKLTLPATLERFADSSTRIARISIVGLHFPGRNRRHRRRRTAHGRQRFGENRRRRVDELPGRAARARENEQSFTSHGNDVACWQQ